jgi:uncharacterized membrane protein
MTRVYLLDNLRGIAFLFMIIHHVFYFFDVSNDYNTKLSSNSFVDTSGHIARNMFILLAGYSTYMAYKKYSEKDINPIKERLKRSGEILIHAMIITFVTYMLYPQIFIRFGILHFIAFGTIICSILAPHKFTTVIIFVLCIILKFPQVNSFIDTITGASSNFAAMDWFPLNKALPIILAGLIIGQHIDINKLNAGIFNNKLPVISFLGSNSLNLYTIHVVGLILFYTFITKINKLET